MNSGEKYLFSDGYLSETLDAHKEKVIEAIEKLSHNQFLATLEDDIVNHFVADMVVEPLTIFEDKRSQDQEEIKIKVDINSRHRLRFFKEGPNFIHGTRVTISLPFTGDKELWKLTPPVIVYSYTIYKDIRLDEDGIGALLLEYEVACDESHDYLKQRIDIDLKLIKKNISWQKGPIDNFNENLPELIKTTVEDRKHRIHNNENLAEFINIPLRHNPGAPTIQPIQIQKRIVKPLPSPPSENYQPEPGISEEIYENILQIIRHEGRTFETTPKTYSIHDEEGLRDIILAHLNGHFLGDAVGEVFRRSGNTDLRIEAGNREAFVAECKIWRGPQTVTDSIDQLLRYLTWRDCKDAIIIFNKDVAGFMEILDKAVDRFQKHPRFMKLTQEMKEGECRMVFRSKEDDTRLVHLHVFLFNLYFQPTK